MPEINEIRKNADFIKKRLKGKYIKEIKILGGRYKKQPFEKYQMLRSKAPIKVIDIKTKGKLLYIVLEDNIHIFNTFGLTGGWCYQSDSKIDKKEFQFPETLDDYSVYLSDTEMNSYIKNSLNHLNVMFKTNEGTLYYYDTLSFGTIKVVTSLEEVDKKLNTIGPDIMDISTVEKTVTNCYTICSFLFFSSLY